MTSDRPHHIRVTEISQFVGMNSCERWLRLAYNEREAAGKLPFYDRLFNPLDPVLQTRGKEREEEWAQSLRSDGVKELTTASGERLVDDPESVGPLNPPSDDGEDVEIDEDDKKMDWDEFRAAVQGLDRGQPGFAREVSIDGNIGVFNVEGRIDFLIVTWHPDGPRLRVVETKSSRKDKTSHRIQAAVYEQILEQKLQENALLVTNGVITADSLQCTVGRIDESTNQIEDILNIDPLDLTRERNDIERLLQADGRIENIITTPEDEIDQLDYRLEPKCDQCVFDVHCFAESGRKRRLELLGIAPSTVRAIEKAGVDTIDQLAELDLDSDTAEEIRTHPSVQTDLADLRTKARARVDNLPDLQEGSSPPDTYPVQTLENQPQSQLPTHEQDGKQTIRIYLNVDYDYVEDRIIALAAHITNSEWELETTFEQTDDGWETDPIPVEVPPTKFSEIPDHIDAEEGDQRPFDEQSIVRCRTRNWTGDYERDTETESQFIEEFLQAMIDELIEVSDDDSEYIHFYVWSPSEIEHLIDACSRGGTRLLNHLRQLLGCRKPTEQLIYSSLQDEVRNRYATGWTGEGLAVNSALNWFSDTYHWTREVAGETEKLDHTFTQDIFDFKTELGLNDDNTWADSREDADITSKFEIHSRFFDSLPLGYMYSVWRDLPDREEIDGDENLRNVVDRYRRADRRSLKKYLGARTHALRWIDEHIEPKNEDIQKREEELSELDVFKLGVHQTARAALDFLMLDHSSAVTEWYAENMQSVSHRVPQGQVIPLQNARIGEDVCVAELDFDGFAIGVDEFRRRTSFEEGSHVRMAVYDGDPDGAPTFGQLQRMGFNGVIEEIDWDAGLLYFDRVYWPENRYRLRSRPRSGDVGEYVYSGNPDLILTDTVSDHSAGRVHDRLESGLGTHVFDWFDPTGPNIPAIEPLAEGQQETYETLLKDYLTFGDGNSLMDSQRDAIIDGLNSRVQLIHGPPGTGKTTTTAMSILMRALHRLEDGERIIVTGSTHKAVDTLLVRVQEYVEELGEQIEKFGLELPDITVAKVTSSDPDEGDVPENIDPDRVRKAGSNYRRWNQMNEDGVLVVGGTVNAVLKDINDIDELPSVDEPYQISELVVDEASMMVFPHFLALSTIVEADGHIMLAGDHRQLSPIVSHEWEEEDRPPIELYQPFSSAFEAVRDLERDESVSGQELRGSPLKHSFRLPPAIRAIIRQLYRSYDDLELEGQVAEAFEPAPDTEAQTPFEAIWNQDTGLFLLAHDERESRLSNDFEVSLVREIIDSADGLSDDSVAVLTPHTAQRSNLEMELEDELDGPIRIIDTVDSLQGDECKNIIVSATASDPTAIGGNEEFLLDLNRSNVAFSRTESRLIVLCSKTFLDHIPPELEEYNSAMLWKSLRNLCTEPVGREELQGHSVDVLWPNPDAPELEEVIKRETSE